MSERKWPWALIVTVLIQTAIGLIWAGGAAARIGVLETRVDEQKLVAERLARLEAQGEATRASLARIERIVEGSK